MELSSEAKSHTSLTLRGYAFYGPFDRFGVKDKIFQLSNTVYTTNPSNNIVLVQNTFTFIVDVLGACRPTKDIFIKLTTSSHLEIYSCHQLSDIVETFFLQDIKCMDFLTPCCDTVVSLSHCSQFV